MGRIYEFKRHFLIRSPETVPAYHVLRVRPVMEYGIQLWGLATKDQLNKKEMLQSQMLCLIASFRKLSRFYRVQLLKLQTMRERHQQYILVQVFKMIHGASAIPRLWPYQEEICRRLRHENQREIVVPPHANDFNYFQFFTCQAPRLWNELPHL
eukprot:GHVN01009438.1.p2 GENE.GHVN01009438.1~~GHVN01009438.1.p2  ORF type:complete len:154 (+),score=9.40 GHVN01009438.1:760-1221(+)